MDKRPIPFNHMIYIGDGLTDVPCLSLIQKYGGAGIGIIHEDKVDKLAAARRQTFQAC